MNLKNISPLIYQYNETIYLWEKPEDINILEKFLPKGFLIIEEENWNEQLQEFIVPLSKDYIIHFDNIKKEEVKNIKPQMSILLKEKGEYLVFEAVFSYNDYTIKQNDKEKIIIPFEDRLLIIHRNLEVEAELVNKIQQLHSLFVKTTANYTFGFKRCRSFKK